MFTLVAVVLSSHALAATQGQLVAAPVYLDDAYLGEAVIVAGEAWIPVLALDASFGDALSIEEGVLLDTTSTNKSEDSALSEDLVSFRDLGMTEAEFVNLVVAFEGATVEHMPFVFVDSDDAAVSVDDPHAGSMVRLEDVSAALDTKVYDGTGGGMYDGTGGGMWILYGMTPPDGTRILDEEPSAADKDSAGNSLPYPPLSAPAGAGG